MFLARRKKMRDVTLKEVEVKASRVLFYHKGDTLVYNADAFVLAEGTMLDGLIQQMPGVEITGNGEIKVNGMKIDALLLNGKDFFNGKKELMLENLPAYTVKNIAIYNKRDRLGDMLGRNTDDTQHVMDVRLKREYRTGWLVNANLGAGTRERYLGRLFGLWFSDNIGIGLFANVNNLSDSSTPGRMDGAWSREKMGEGVKSTRQGGITYNGNFFGNRWDFNGDVVASNATTVADASTNTQHYLATGDLFTYRWKRQTDESTRLSTSHTANGQMGKRVLVYNSLSLEHERNRNNSSDLSAMFSAAQDSLTESVVRNLFMGDALGARALINRYVDDNLVESTTSSGRNSNTVTFITRNTGLKNMLKLRTAVDLSRRVDDRFSRYTIQESAPSSTPTFSNRYFRNHPDRNHSVSALLEFKQILHEYLSDAFTLQYSFTNSGGVETANRYLLNLVEGFDSRKAPLGTLPSMNAWLGALDAAQSFNTSSADNTHSLSVSYLKNCYVTPKVNVVPQLQASADYAARSLHYFSASGNQRVKRDGMLYTFRPKFGVCLTQTDSLYGNEIKIYHWFNANYNYEPLQTPLMSAVSRFDTANPLNVVTGNPDIADAYKHSVELSYKRNNDVQMRFHTVALRYESISGALATGVYYNPQTGVCVTRPFNVDGNRLLEASYNFFIPFGAYNKFDINSMATVSGRRSVDISGTFTTGDMPDFSVAPTLRTVNNFMCSEKLTFNCKLGSHRLTATAYADRRSFSSPDPSFSPFASWNTNLGLSGVANLPRNWSLSTDLNLYTRRGYADARLNTSDLVWNARLSRSLLGGALTVALDGYDLLHQLSNVTYTVNAQARTETVANVVPSYLLLHLSYRFNRNPRR